MKARGTKDLPLEWKEIFDGVYAISNHGHVKRIKAGKGALAGKLLLAHQHRTGYMEIWLLGKMWLIHRLVADNFIGPCPSGHEVDHINGDKTDNKVTNLEYVTRSENKKRSIAMGLVIMPKGEAHPRAKLSDQDCRDIRRLATTGKSQREIARHYDVSQYAIWHIIHRRRE